MGPTLLLNRPVAKPRIVAKITKFNNLVEVSTKARKSSTKLRKVFEKGSYQKKTQLSVLNRYKRRLETIQKQNDRSFRKKQKVKVKLPDIKKYVGNFFTPKSTNDPLKAIAALAAFKAVQKGSKGDLGGALASGLVAAGLTFGPSLLGRGISSVMNKGGGGGGAASPTTTSGGSRFFGTPYSQTRAGQAYAGMQAQRNLPGWAQRAAGGSASRFAASNERLIQGTANIGDRARVATGGRFGIGNIAERIATRGGGVAAEAATARAGGTVAAKAAGVGARAIPLLGTAVNIGLSAYRFSQGDVVGGILSAVSAIPIVGWAALGIDLAREFGAFDGTFLGRQGQDKLKTQTEQQKRAVERKKEEGGTLTFRKTLNGYEKAVNKFEEFVKGFKGGMGMQGEQSGVIETGNRGFTTGETLQDLEATGGEVPGTPNSPYGPRGGRLHKGNDYNRPVGTPISIIQPGTVTVADMNYDPSGWGAVVEIRHQDGSISRYAHLSEINVVAGTQVSPGQVIGKVGGAAGAPGSGNSTGAHLHFEYENGSGRIDPTSIAPRIFRFGGNVRVRQQSSRPSTAEQLRAIGQSGAAQVIERQQPPVPRRPPSVASPPRAPRGVGSFLPYQQGYNQQVTAFYPVSQPQQQPMPSEDVPMMMTGPSEQQLLNSFYKRVLLNTV